MSWRDEIAIGSAPDPASKFSQGRGWSLQFSEAPSTLSATSGPFHHGTCLFSSRKLTSKG